MEPTFFPYVTSSATPSPPPPRADSIFESLPGVLDQLEQDEHLALLAPTYNHSKESTRDLFVQSLESETLRKFGQPDALPNVASICKKVTRKAFDIRFNSVELNALADGPQKTNLIQLRENIARSLGRRAETPLVMATLTRRNTHLETWGPARKSVPDHKTRHKQDIAQADSPGRTRTIHAGLLQDQDSRPNRCTKRPQPL